MPVIRERVQQARGSSTHWSRSGRHGSSRDRTDFDPAVAVRTRSQRSIRSPRVPTRTGGGCWTRTWRRRSTESTMITYSHPARRVPSQGTDRRVAEVGCDREWSVHPDGGKSSAEWGDQPVAR